VLVTIDADEADVVFREVCVEFDEPRHIGVVDGTLRAHEHENHGLGILEISR
jgi:hypothetical protein